MTQPLILLMRAIPSHYLEDLKSLAPNHQLIRTEELRKDQIDDVEIAFSWDPEVGAELLASPTSRLKWIQVYSAGVDDLPLKQLREKGILLSNASGVHSIPITESVIGMLLTHYRGLQQAIQQQVESHWDNQIPTSELHGKSLLIVGTGAIGRQLANISNFFGLKVYGVNQSGYPLADFLATYPQSQIATILPQVDIVVNILPLTSETYHFYDDYFFAQMKDQSIFINVGRGPSVKTSALINACQQGKLKFAGIDVFEEEPLPADHLLWTLKNVLITPHISGKTDQYNQRFFSIFKRNLASFVADGQLVQNQVILKKGY